MKILNIIIGGVIILSSCKKEESTMVANVDVRIINAAVGTSIKVDPGRNVDYPTQTQISYGGTRIYMLERKVLPFQIVNAVDNTVKFYDETINFNSGIYSVLVAGQGTAIETIVKEEADFPFIDFINKIPVKADSAVNVRFINLSPNGVPVKIKIATAAGNEIDNLPYKTIGGWKRYMSTKTTVYSFQVRDAATDALLTSFNFTANATNRFKNVSLIIKGLQGTTTGVNAFGIMTVNHF